jgi:broad specificity phosphatase PhoE
MKPPRVIILTRHGRPALRTSKRVPSASLRSVARRYDEAGIRRTPAPPADLRRRAASAGIIVCSDTRRAVESARALDRTRDPLTDRVFREAGLPLVSPLPLPLSFEAWMVIARIAWFLGWSAGGESVTHARRRARRAARRLIGLSATHQSVMLIGHGVFNALIAVELRRSGWRGPPWNPTASHWGSASYSREVTEPSVTAFGKGSFRARDTPAHQKH